MRLARLADLYLRSRWLIALFVAAMTIAASVGVSRLAFDDSPLNIFRTKKPDFALLEEVFADFGTDDRDCVVVIDGADLFTPQAVAMQRRLVEQFRKLPHVESVRSMDDVVVVAPGEPLRSLLPPADAAPEEFARAREAALAHSLIAGQVLAPDGRTALIIVRLTGRSLAIHEVDQRIGEMRAAMDAAELDPSVARVRLTGVPSIRREIFASIRRDSKLFVVIGVILSFFMASLLFRRMWPIVAVAAPPLLAAFWTMGLLGLLGVKVNVINTVLPTLVMVIGFTDSMHLMVDIRHSVRLGRSNTESARLAIEHLLPACALTSLTTAVGFGSLAIAGVEVIRSFGFVCAAGALLAFTAVISLVPLIASIAPPGSFSRGPDYEESDAVTRFGLRIIRWVINHPRRVAFAGIAATIAFGLISLRLVPSNRLTESIPPASESYQALSHCDRELGGMLRAFVLVRWNEGLGLQSPAVLAAMTDVDRLLADGPGTKYPLSALNLLASLPGPAGDLAARVPLLFALVPADITAQYVQPARREALMTMHLQDVGSARHEATFQHIERELNVIAARHPGVQLQLTGTAVVASRNINQMITDLTSSPGLAAGVIFLMMALLFRSWRLGAISIVPNVFPMFATATILVLTGQELQLTSVITFSICLGIAVDDTIHFVNRFQRELAVDGDVRGAIERAFMAVGTAIAMTTLVLLTGFMSVCLSEMPTSRLFGTLGCLAIGTAIIGDLIILPALLTCFAPRPRQIAGAPAAEVAARPAAGLRRPLPPRAAERV